MLGSAGTGAHRQVGLPYVKLNNGVEMPRFGLGTYAVSNDDCRQACLGYSSALLCRF